MNARALLLVFDTVYLVALSAWVGSALFMAFGLGPVVLKVLGAEPASRFMRALLARYYAWGATAGAIALAAFVCGPLSVPEFRGSRVAAQAGLLLAGTLIMLYGGNSLTPALNAGREGGPDGQQRFDRLLRRSAWLNRLVLACGLMLLAGFATRPAPTTEGIVEPSPVERAILNEEQYQKILDKARKPSSRPLGDWPLPIDPKPSGVR